MPKAPPRHTPGTTADRHKPRENIYDKARPHAAARGYGARHKRWRKIILQRDPLCVYCKRQGKITPATVADHIETIAEAPERQYDTDNGQGLCKACHDTIKQREDAAQRRTGRPLGR